MITPVDAAQRRRLVQLYGIANTPGYLLRWLRTDPIVQTLAARESASSLVAFIAEVDANEGRRLEDVALAYAATAALTLMNYSEVAAALPFRRLKALAWVVPVLQLWDQTRRSQTALSFDAPASVPSPEGVASTSGTISLGFDVG
jgi:hypothetical protein